MTEIASGVVFFTGIVLVLVLLVLAAKRIVVPSGECVVTINERASATALVGQRLLDVLVKAGANVPSACGGAGTCGLCKVKVTGAGDAGPQERAHLSRVEQAHNTRLACQVSVLADVTVEVDEAYFGVATLICTVKQARNVSTLIREIELALPPDERMDFRAGGFVQITCPPFHLRYTDFAIENEYRDIWDKLNLWRLEVASDKAVTRAYSMANHPGESGKILLNVRIALPPPGVRDVPPGLLSSWLFARKPGDQVQVMGPYGHFFVQESSKEAIFVGGGAGMAPLRAQILDLLEIRHSKRRITFWYGARSRRELFYTGLFDRLAAEHDNFDWYVALSEPEPDDDWQGYTGFVHRLLLEEYLNAHQAPEDCEYYLCGPPLMVTAVLSALDELGVDRDSIYFDDFGG